MVDRPWRVVHYVNQFFGGVGGEDKADHPLELRSGPVGPGIGLQSAFASDANIVATLVCGDNAFHEPTATVRDTVRRHLGELRPDLVVAGPAFNAGRYGAACGEVCQIARELSIPALTGLHPDNPAVALYRRSVPIVPVAESAIGMRDALPRMAAAGLLLVRDGEPKFPASAGFLPRGLRRNLRAEASGAERAADMLLAKLRGLAFHSEIPLPPLRRHDPAPGVADLGRATVALISTGGIVPAGNPDGLKHINEPRWKRYPIAGLREMSAQHWEPIHGGYDASWARQDPNLVVPLDALRALEAQGAVGALHDQYYAAVGVGLSVSQAETIGAEMADQLIRDGVAAAILTAT